MMVLRKLSLTLLHVRAPVLATIACSSLPLGAQVCLDVPGFSPAEYGYAWSITTADFSEDGHPDLAFADSDDISVLPGDGLGGSGGALFFPAGDRPRSIAAADFDGDGHLDLAVASRGRDTVTVLLSYGCDCNGNGVWDPQDTASGASDDCDGNAIPDECDIASGAAADCSANGIPDECELTVDDCNGNGVWDACDIAVGTSDDCNGNDIPDECDIDSGLSE